MRNKSDNDGIIGCLALIFMIIFFMPIVGAGMLLSKDDEKRGIGLILLIVGLLIWAWLKWGV